MLEDPICIPSWAPQSYHQGLWAVLHPSLIQRRVPLCRMSQLSTSVKSRVQGFQISRASSTKKDMSFPSCSTSIWNLNSVSLTRVTGRERRQWLAMPSSQPTHTHSRQLVGCRSDDIEGRNPPLQSNFEVLSSDFCLRFDILVTELRLYYET